jgi:8-oxo-dGTP diphosphatase
MCYCLFATKGLKMKLYPLVMADVALFTVQDDELRVLLLQRANEPEQGRWALPGGILKPEIDGSLDDTARRVLRDKTGVDVPFLRQVQAFSGAHRDPRGWSVSTLYYALLPSDRIDAIAGPKAEALAWGKASAPGKRLAFDHGRLLAAALAALRLKVELSALPLHLLPEDFTLTQLQRACEAILERALEKSAFRRRLRGDPSMVPIEGEFLRGAQRPAQVFRATGAFRFD